MHESSDSLSLSRGSIAYSSTARATPSALPIFLARFPEPDTDDDRSGLTNFIPGVGKPNPVGDNGINLLPTGGLQALSLPIPGVGLGGLVPRTESTGLGGLVPSTESTALIGLVPLAKIAVSAGLVPRTEHVVSSGLPLNPTAFRDLRNLETRVWIVRLSTPPEIFFARFSASVATAEDLYRPRVDSCCR